MKTAKKLFTAFLAVMMIAVLAVPAFADGEDSSGDTGTDTETAGTYSIKITAMDNSDAHKFNAYQIFKGTLSSDGTLIDVKWGGAITANDDLYTAIKAISYEEGDETKKPFENLPYDTAASVSDILVGLVNNTAAVEAFQATIAEKVSSTQAKSLDYSSNGVYTVTGLEAGYYLIKDERTDGENVADMMLRVVGNVEATAKLNVPSVKKYAGAEAVSDNATFSVGDEIEYTLVGTTPNYNSEVTSYSYTFTDTMDAALDLVYTPSTSNSEQVEGGVKVTIGTGDGAADITAKFLITYKNHVLTIASNVDLKGSGIAADSNLYVTYKATVNSGVLTGHVVENKVQVESKVGGDTTQTPEVTEQVYPITLKITKVDGEEKTKTLEGAKFHLTRTVGEETQYATTNLSGKFTGWTTNEAKAAELATDENGLIELVGIGAGTFTLTETAAPAGYNLLTGGVVIEIASESETSDTGTVKLKSLSYSVDNGAKTNVTGDDLTNGIVSVTVENNKGATLPSTGGMGTTLFYVVGGILVVGAVVLLVTRKRMDKE